jgi:hypothetical protein
MTAMSKRPLIFESVMVIRIGVHPVGEEPDQHVVHVAPRISHTITFCEVPTRSKSGLFSDDEILVPNDRLTRSSSWATLFSLHKPPQSREGQFDKVVTKLLGLPGPIKPDMWPLQIKTCPLGPKMMWSLIDTSMGYHLGISMARSPPFPSECSTSPYLPCPVTPINININIYSSIAKITF